jgi:tetratricopeptide (TPR) repeat protein
VVLPQRRSFVSVRVSRDTWKQATNILLSAKFGAMQNKKQQHTRQQGPGDSAPDSESQDVRPEKTPTCDELTERGISIGDGDSYNHLLDSLQASISFSSWHKILAVLIVLIVALLAFFLIKSHTASVSDVKKPTPKLAVQKSKTLSPKSRTEDTPPQPEQRVQGAESAPYSTEPLSLKVAESFYLGREYEKAYEVYRQIDHSMAKKSREDELLSDFLKLKMALCLQKTQDIDSAMRLMRWVSKSRSPAISSLASYHLSLIEIMNKQYLNARTNAYRTIALIDSVDFDNPVASLLIRNCHFIVAQCLTQKVLSLCHADNQVPGPLWTSMLEVDPFININEADLLSFLSSGSEQLAKGILGPRITELEPSDDALGRWSVLCYKTSVEELMAKFAATTDLDVLWVLNKEAMSDPTADGVRLRTVDLYLSAATDRQIATVATGCAGLMATFDKKSVVSIYNPQSPNLLSEQVSLLSDEAMSLWQQFLLRFHNDERIANVHFAMGLLRAQRGDVVESAAEYKLLANRFSQSPLAPFALLNSSELKTSLRDYVGARQDLMQLVAQYPNTAIAEQACLYLADITMKAGLNVEAQRLYRKVYNLGFSVESQTAAALGAGMCCYEEKEYENAIKWLFEYIGLAKDNKDDSLYRAYFLLGKANSAMGKTQQACMAFEYALAGQHPPEDYVQIVSALIQAYIEQESYIEALGVLGNIDSWRLSQRQNVEILVLKSKVLRQMGLIDRAVAALGDRAEYILAPELKARILFELAQCYTTDGRLELARRNLTEILVSIDAGPLSEEVALQLAEVCLKMGQEPKTISICSQLLDLDPSEELRKKTLLLLAKAHNKHQDYDRAALALLGHRKPFETQQTEKE